MAANRTAKFYAAFTPKARSQHRPFTPPSATLTASPEWRTLMSALELLALLAALGTLLYLLHALWRVER